MRVFKWIVGSLLIIAASFVLTPSVSAQSSGPTAPPPPVCSSSNAGALYTQTGTSPYTVWTCSYYNLQYQWVVNPSYGGLVYYPTLPSTCSGYLPVFLSGWPNTQEYVCQNGIPVSLNSPAGFTLTTTGTSGAATLSGTVLNIPNYGSGGPFLPLSGGTLTGPLNGTSATFSGTVAAGTIGAVIQAAQQPGADAGAKIIAANNACVAAGGGTIDARGLAGTQTLSSTVYVGKSDQSVGCALILPTTAHWNCTSTNPVANPACLYEYGGSAIYADAPNGGGNRMVIQCAAGSVYHWCVQTDTAQGYYRINNFSIYDQVGSVLLEGGLGIVGADDESDFDGMIVNTANGNNGEWAKFICCQSHALHQNLSTGTTNTNGTGAPLRIGDDIIVRNAPLTSGSATVSGMLTNLTSDDVGKNVQVNHIISGSPAITGGGTTISSVSNCTNTITNTYGTFQSGCTTMTMAALANGTGVAHLQINPSSSSDIAWNSHFSGTVNGPQVGTPAVTVSGSNPNGLDLSFYMETEGTNAPFIYIESTGTTTGTHVHDTVCNDSNNASKPCIENWSVSSSGNSLVTNGGVDDRGITQLPDVGTAPYGVVTQWNASAGIPYTGSSFYWDNGTLNYGIGNDNANGPGLNLCLTCGTMFGSSANAKTGGVDADLHDDGTGTHTLVAGINRTDNAPINTTFKVGNVTAGASISSPKVIPSTTPWLDVQFYNVVGDGTTDNCTNLTTAVNTANSLGLTLKLPNNFNAATSCGLTLTTSIAGVDWTSQITALSGLTTAPVTLTASNISASDLTINANGYAANALKVTGTGLINIDARHVQLLNPTAQAYVCATTGSANAQVSLYDSVAAILPVNAHNTPSGSIGVSITGCSDGEISHSKIEGFAYGISQTGHGNYQFIGNQAWGYGNSAGTGSLMLTAFIDSVGSDKWIGNTADSMQNIGFDFSGATAGPIIAVGNRVQSYQTFSPTSGVVGMKFGTQQNIAVANTFQGGSTTPISNDITTTGSSTSVLAFGNAGAYVTTSYGDHGNTLTLASGVTTVFGTKEFYSSSKYTFSTPLPTCNSSNDSVTLYVTDAPGHAMAYGSGGGTTRAWVQCDGTAAAWWVQ